MGGRASGSLETWCASFGRCPAKLEELSPDTPRVTRSGKTVVGTRAALGGKRYAFDGEGRLIAAEYWNDLPSGPCSYVPSLEDRLLSATRNDAGVLVSPRVDGSKSVFVYVGGEFPE